MAVLPKTGFQGLIENWQSDLLAALSVSLVALPLALGIAYASSVPPMAGILSAVIGGVVTTFFRGSHMAINGPAAGLIAVVVSSIMALDDGTGQALNYVFAAIVVSGGLQVILGLMRLGRFADLFHSSVIHGILAAIGIIIFAKQIHIALDTKSTSASVLQDIYDVFTHIPDINPFVAVISLVGLLLLIFHAKISFKLFHFLPAPIWVLLLSIPFVYFFNFFEEHTISLFGNSYEVGPDLLVAIPDNILDAISRPNFSKMNTMPFWLSVISITMIASIESLASSKAVDKLDPYRRRTNLNKDLIGIGISTMVCGALGGLPIITVIVRSTVNVHNHAKTKWANLYHGLLLLLFIFLLAPVIQKVPLCALAILLVYTGFKLASPKVFAHIYDQGVEQLVFFIGTLGITLATDLLVGIFGGLVLALITHMLLAKVSIPMFFRMIFNSGSNLYRKKDGSYDLKIKGIANFLSMIKFDKLVDEIPMGSNVQVDFSEARLVDHSILESVYEIQRMHRSKGGKFEINGFHNHISTSSHKLALKIQTASAHRLTSREISLQDMAEEYGWSFDWEPEEQINYLETFYFFKSRPVEEKHSRIAGVDEDIEWEVSDVVFEEGAFMASEGHKTTLGMIKLPFQIAKFTIEKKDFLAKYIDLAAHKDIDYTLYHDFSKKFNVKVENEENFREFITPEIRALIELSNWPHLESNGEAILIFNDHFKFAPLREYTRLIEFSEQLRKLIKAARKSGYQYPVEAGE